MASSTTSTPHKTSELKTKSCDTACSLNSGCFFRKRKTSNPLAASFRGNVNRRVGNTVHERVLSAKMLKLRSIQNQLNDANFHLTELIRENQTLKSLQKRQDKALSKYEGTNAELPRLLKTHEEEIRVLTETNRNLKRTIKELNDQLKSKSDEITNLHDRLKHFEKLDKDKNLLEREQLAETVKTYKTKLEKADEEIVVLSRKLTLEIKSGKQKLNSEVIKHKMCQKQLSQVLCENARLNQLLQNKELPSTADPKRIPSILHARQTRSMVTLNGSKSHVMLNPEQSSHSSQNGLKLEPINSNESNNNNNNSNHRKDQVSNGNSNVTRLFDKSPIDNIRARLSSSGGSSENGSTKNAEDVASINSPKSDDNDNTEADYADGDSQDKIPPAKSRPNSAKKLEKITVNIQNTIKRVELNANRTDFDKCLGDYCLQAVDSVKKCSTVINTQKNDLRNVISDTDKLVKSMNEIKEMESKLKRSDLLSSFDVDNDNLDFVSKILNEELTFQKKYGKDNRNGDGWKEPVVDVNDRKQLIATLKAIDKEDSS